MSIIPMKNIEESKNTTFEHITPENELTKSKLHGNLKQYITFLQEDIILNDKSLIIDCGANIGEISSVFARYGATVHAFEPTKVTFDLLQNRFSMHKNVHCYKNAVWINDEILKFYHHEWSNLNQIHWSNGNSLLKEKKNVNEMDYEFVEAIDIVKFIKSLEQEVDLIKIDIEGAEIEILNHIIDSGIIDKVHKVICEVHDKKYTFLKEKTNRLRRKIKEFNLSNKINLDWH